jgi:hypothetical protein
MGIKDARYPLRIPDPKKKSKSFNFDLASVDRPYPLAPHPARLPPSCHLLPLSRLSLISSLSSIAPIITKFSTRAPPICSAGLTFPPQVRFQLLSVVAVPCSCSCSCCYRSVRRRRRVRACRLGSESSAWNARGAGSRRREEGARCCRCG